MNELFETMVADASAFDSVNAKKGSELSSLIRNSQQLSKQIKEAEQHLKDLKAMRHKVDTESIPATMQEMGMDSITVDGNKVQLKPFVHASIPQDRKGEAYDWLRSIGESDIIKNDVVVSFSMGEDNLAKSVIADLEEKGVNPSSKTHIHPMTLKSWLSDRIKDGKEVDLEMFGAYVGTTATFRKV